MSLRGRPPKPTSLKLLQGTLRKHRENPNEPKPPASSLRPPSYLNEDERKQWRVIAKELRNMGVLTTADRTMLARYCELQVFWQTTKTAAKIQPKAIGLLLKVAIELRTIEVQFGLTPASRSKIHVASPPQPPGKLARYLNRKKTLFGDDALTPVEREAEKRFFGDDDEKQALKRRFFGDDDNAA